MHAAEERNPSYALTHFELGTVYEKLGNYGEASSQLEAALKLHPALAAPYYHLGAVYARLGRSEESKAAYEKFRAMKEQLGQANPDPAAAAISDQEHATPQANSRPPAGTVK